MAQVRWETALDAEKVFSDFERVVGEGAAKVRPGDHVLVLGQCTACSAPLFQTATPDPRAKEVAYDLFPEASARELQRDIASSPPACPRCRAPQGGAAMRNLHIARVAPLWAEVLWFNFTWKGTGWGAPEVFVFTPPDDWKTLGVNPANEPVYGAWGRAAHPAVAAIAAYRAVLDNKGASVRWVTQECAFVAYDATLPPSDDKVLAAVNQYGVPPPYLTQKWPGGQVPEFLKRAGVEPSVRRMMGARVIGVTLVVSDPALRTRIAQWATATGGAINVDLDGRVTLLKEFGRERSTLEDIKRRLAVEGLTPDDTLFEMGASQLSIVPPAPRASRAPTLRPAAPVAPLPPRPPQAAPAPAAVRAGVDPASGVGWRQQAPPPAHTEPAFQARGARLCPSCGRPAHLVRRVFDTTRIDSLYKPKPVYFEKHFTTYTVALMLTCGEHMRPVSELDLAHWGITADQALGEVVAWMPYDELAAWRHVHFTEKHVPIVGLVGPFICSVVAHDLWLEQAIRSTMVELGNPVRVECTGENVISFRPIKQSDQEKVGRKLRKQSKAWGLAEPRIAFTYSRKFARPPTAVGRVVIKGSL